MSNTFDPNAASLPDAGVFGLPNSLDDSRVVLIPVPFEATTSYGGGTSAAPAAIFQASQQVDLYDYGTGRPYEAGIFMLPADPEIEKLNRKAKKWARPVIEAGGVITTDKLAQRLQQVNVASARVNEIVYQTAKSLIAEGKLVGVVGGDHSTPFGLIQAYSEVYPNLGILHLDAHCDLRKAFEGFQWSHASIMYNVVELLPAVKSLVQVGIRDFSESEQQLINDSAGRIVTYFDEMLALRKFDGQPWNRLVDEIIRPLPDKVYLSFDIDGLDPALCPHTGTPVPGGLSFAEAVALLGGVVRSGRTIIGFDLNEVSPAADGKDEWDANVGARLLYKMIGYTLLSQK